MKLDGDRLTEGAARQPHRRRQRRVGMEVDRHSRGVHQRSCRGRDRVSVEPISPVDAVVEHLLGIFLGQLGNGHFSGP